MWFLKVLEIESIKCCEYTLYEDACILLSQIMTIKNHSQKIENYPVLLWMLWAGLSLVHCKINLSQTEVGLQFSFSGWDVHLGLPDSPTILHNPLVYWLPTPCNYTVTIILFLTCIIVKLVYFYFFPWQWMSTCQKTEWHSRTRGMDLWSSWEKKMQITQSK